MISISQSCLLEVMLYYMQISQSDVSFDKHISVMVHTSTVQHRNTINYLCDTYISFLWL